MLSNLKTYLLNWRKPTPIVVYGSNSPDWQTALEPCSPVWAQIKKAISTRIMVRHIEENTLPQSIARDTIVIPLMERHIELCLNDQCKHLRMLIPTREALQVLRDKLAFATYCSANGLAHLCPEHYSNMESVRYPCVIKRTDQNAGSGIALATSAQHLESLLEQSAWKDKSWMLQEFIPGIEERVTHCVAHEGKVVWHCTFTYELDERDPIHRGILPTHPASMSPRQLEQIERLLAPLKYSGPCNVDYKCHENGDIIVFEINPRLGGSLMQRKNCPHLGNALFSIISHSAPQTTT